MYGGWIAVRTITYLLRGPPRQCRCRSVRTTVIRPPCLSIRKILPTTGYSSVGDVDNSVSSRAQKQNSTLICYWASAGVGRTIRFAKSVAGHARGNRSAAGDTRGGTRDDTSQCSPDFTSRDLRQSAVGELRPP